jgi:hypothetical protein
MPGIEPAPPIARAVHEWISGHRDSYERFFFAETAEAAAAFAVRATRRDALFAPDGGPLPSPGPATVIPYGGLLREPGDELLVSGRTVELQDYAAAAFVDVLGPTVVRFVGPHDWTAFLDDAVIAHETGVLPPQLRDPRMQLAERAALLDPLRIARPDSFASHGEGSVTFGPQGIVLGAIDESGTFEASVPRIAALGGVVPVRELVACVTERPWLPRLIALADLRRALPGDRALAPVSGFGAVLVDDGHADADPIARDPFLVIEDEQPILADPASRRQFRVSMDAARVVEIVQTSSTAAHANVRIAKALGATAEVADSLRHQALDVLGVHHGASRAAVAAIDPQGSVA